MNTYMAHPPKNSHGASKDLDSILVPHPNRNLVQRHYLRPV